MGQRPITVKTVSPNSVSPSTSGENSSPTSDNGVLDPVPELKRLLGEPVVFIDWPKGTKGTRKKWKHLTVDHMVPEFLDRLKWGNIGVALGKVSGGLCAIDADTDHFATAFLAANPALADTLQTHGNRGRVFWVRLVGAYPKTTKLTDQSGKGVGEFRSNGAQSIISGTHPDTKRPYTFVMQQPVVEIEYSKIIWPQEIFNPPECTEDDGRNRRDGGDGRDGSYRGTTSVASVSSVHSAGSCSTIQSLEDVLCLSLPNAPHTNNDSLFVLARGIKTLEGKGGRFSISQLRDAFSQWYIRAMPFLRPEGTKDDYLIEFLDAYRRAKFPFGGETIPKAWKAANEEPMPPEADQFKDTPKRRLVALCWQLQKLAGKEPFFLSSRKCQDLFKLSCHTTAAKWLRALCLLGIIEEVKKGDSRYASRYMYRSRKE